MVYFEIQNVKLPLIKSPIQEKGRIVAVKTQRTYINNCVSLDFLRKYKPDLVKKKN